MMKDEKDSSLTERCLRQVGLSDWSFWMEVWMDRTSSSLWVSQESKEH